MGERRAFVAVTRSGPGRRHVCAADTRRPAAGPRAAVGAGRQELWRDARPYCDAQTAGAAGPGRLADGGAAARMGSKLPKGAISRPLAFSRAGLSRHRNRTRRPCLAALTTRQAVTAPAAASHGDGVWRGEARAAVRGGDCSDAGRRLYARRRARLSRHLAPPRASASRSPPRDAPPPRNWGVWL